MPPVKTVGVISTGVIGSSFVALFLSYGLHVLVCSPSGSPGSEAKLAANLERIWLTLDPATLAHGASLSNYTFVGASLDGYYDEVDFVQENAPENLELKRRLLAEIDAGLATRPEVVIATSSSGLLASTLVTKCAHHPERVLVGHPYNPPHLIPLVEVVPHPQTDPAASEGAVDFYRFLGRQPVLVKKETPGFVANRLQAVLMREAFSLVLNGVVSAEEVDLCVTEALGPRWAFSGPFMTNVLGGGATKDGFKHLISHIAPAARVWYEDMDAKKVDVTSGEDLERLDESVQAMLRDRDLKAFQKQWGKDLVQLFRMKDMARGSGSA